MSNGKPTLDDILTSLERARDAALEEAANVATEHMRRAELILSKPDPELNELNAMFFEVEADTAADIAIAIRHRKGAA